MLKVKGKERKLKAALKKQKVAYTAKLIRSLADFSAESLKVRLEWQDILKVLKEEDFQPRIPDKIIIQN